MSYDTTILAEPSIVHYWSMGDAGGSTAAADTKGATNLTKNGSVTFGTTSMLPLDASTCAAFGGAVGDYLTYPSGLVGAGAQSVEFWINTSVATNTVAVFYSQDNAKGLDIFHDNDNHLKLNISTTLCDTGVAVAPNTLHYIVYTWDGTHSNVYLDNKLVFTNTTAPGSQTTNGAIMRWANGSNFPTPGNLQKLALYNAALTTTQMNNHIAQAETTYGRYSQIAIEDVVGNNVPVSHHSQIAFEPVVGQNPAFAHYSQIALELIIPNGTPTVYALLDIPNRPFIYNANAWFSVNQYPFPTTPPVVPPPVTGYATPTGVYPLPYVEPVITYYKTLAPPQKGRAVFTQPGTVSAVPLDGSAAVVVPFLQPFVQVCQAVVAQYSPTAETDYQVSYEVFNTTVSGFSLVATGGPVGSTGTFTYLAEGV